jgi:hypothetical protein
MSDSPGGCAVCGLPRRGGMSMSKVVIEGRALELCRLHAATVVAAMPETFDDMRALFVGVTIDVDAMIRRDNMIDRRSPLERRAEEDRRVFPPRPEGRRRGTGRRTGDPLE